MEENNKHNVITKNGILQYLKSEAGFADSEAKNLLRNFFSTLEEEVLEGSNVKFHGFGTFLSVKTAERKAKNFKTGERIIVPSVKKIKFTKSKNT